MAGYFDDILAAYGPTGPAPVDPPWSDPFLDLPVPEMPAPPPAPATSEAPRSDPPSPAPAPRHEHEHAPSDLFDPPDIPALPAPTPTERLIERATETRERLVETRTVVEPLLDPAEPPPAPIHLHETADLSVTHLHEHLRLVDKTSFEPDTDGPSPPQAEPPAPAQGAPGEADSRLVALEAELAQTLARLHGDDAPPIPFFAPEDFEPETPDAPPPPDIESQRAVTREVIRELHHHHHTETRIETPKAAPAPRTASEASRIGPIRFLSDWKTGVR